MILTLGCGCGLASSKSSVHTLTCFLIRANPSFPINSGKDGARHHRLSSVSITFPMEFGFGLVYPAKEMLQISSAI